MQYDTEFRPLRKCFCRESEWYDIETSLRRKIVDEAIGIYNELRPHFSNHYLTPNQMHKQKEIKMKTYKSKNQSKNKFALV